MIRQELARMLLFETKDPRLQGIVLTEARVSADLRIAWVTYQLHDASDSGRSAATEGLASASGFLRGSLKTRLAMRMVPELRFEFDDRAHASERIDSILKEVDE
jgi:ribosome-binding factor A